MPSKKSAKGYGCAILFLAPFGLVGLGMAGTSYYLAAKWLSIQSWPETKATINSLQLKESHDDEGSTTYQVIANYDYTWMGQRYSSERVGIHGGNDNVGSFHQRTYANLKPLLNVPEGASCFVNSSQPNEAILVREARWEMFAFYSLFATLFGSIGVVGGMAMWATRRDAVVADAQMDVYPDEPWKWHARWADGEVRSEQQERSTYLKWTAIWWVVVTLPVAVFSIMALAGGHGWALMGLITPVAALFIVRSYLRSRTIQREYGFARLQLQESPLRPGMKTTVAVLFEGGQLPRDTVKSKVECLCRVRSGNGSKMKTEWQDGQQIEPEDCRMLSNGLCIAVPIEIPENARTTTTEDAKVLWKLTVFVPTADGRRKPIKAEFKLPVF